LAVSIKTGVLNSLLFTPRRQGRFGPGKAASYSTRLPLRAFTTGFAAPGSIASSRRFGGKRLSASLDNS
jgi:hypothetical protein